MSVRNSHGSRKAAVGDSEARRRRHLRLAVAALPILVLVLVDVLLRAAGWLPPEDPLVRYARSFEEAFDPFVEGEGGYLSIKPGWINEGTSPDFRLGERPGVAYLLPAFRPARVSLDVPADTLRVFALGGSTTFGLGVGVANAYPELLRRRLAAAFPERTVEMVNLGCPGWASDRIAGLLPRLLELSPDLLVIYSGHNEMLHGATDSSTGLDLTGHVAAGSLRWSSIVAWLHYGISRWRHRMPEAGFDEQELAALLAGQTRVFDPMMEPEERRRLPDAELLTASSRRYARNLRAIHRRASAAGVPVVFVLPVSNLMFPPAYSVHGDTVDERRFQRLLDRAQDAFGARHPEAALESITEAIELSPDYAMSHFWHGVVLSALGRYAEASHAFQRAVDHDIRTHRITSRLETAFLNTMKEVSGAWVDLRPLFRHPLNPDSARALFLDHVHPTRAGHQLIADALVEPAHHALAEHAEEER